MPTTASRGVGQTTSLVSSTRFPRLDQGVQEAVRCLMITAVPAIIGERTLTARWRGSRDPLTLILDSSNVGEPVRLEDRPRHTPRTQQTRVLMTLPTPNICQARWMVGDSVHAFSVRLRAAVLHTFFVPALLAVLGCGGGDGIVVKNPNPEPTPARVNAVTVSPTNTTVQIGSKTPFVAQVEAQGGAATTITWITSDASRATVTATGALTADVTGVSAGPVTITARSTFDATKEGSGQVIVTPPPTAPTISLVVAPNTLTLTAGGPAGPTTVTLTRSAGFTASVDLTTEGLPTGVTATVSPSTLGPTATIGTVSLTAAAAAQAGPFTMTVRARAQGASDATATTLVTVQRVVPRIGSIAVGDIHSCALSTTGQAYCWGSAGSGQLGDGTITNNRIVPVAVAGGRVFTSITAGQRHTCGLVAGGQVFCWGLNANGQLGDGTTTDRAVPTPVTGGLAFKAIAAGWSYTCGVTTGGQAYCWGLNGHGELGDGSTTDRRTPTPVSDVHTYATIAAGNQFSCGVLANATAYCWGTNTHGQLGDGTNTLRTIPTAVGGGRSFALIVAGYEHTCGASTGSGAYCWGSNEDGSLGDGTSTDQLTPKPLTTDRGNFTAVTAGVGHTCALTSDQQAYCWGLNNLGQVGNGTLGTVRTPIVVIGAHTFSAIGAGNGHTCGLGENAQVFCWGANQAGQLGDGTQTDRLAPVLVAFSAAGVIAR